MKRRLQIAMFVCFTTLYSAAVLAIVLPPPYGTLRTYYDKQTGIVKGQYVSCGEFSYSWGQSNGYAYRDQSIVCP